MLLLLPTSVLCLISYNTYWEAVKADIDLSEDKSNFRCPNPMRSETPIILYCSQEEPQVTEFLLFILIWEFVTSTWTVSSEQHSVGFELMICLSFEVTLLNYCLTFKEKFKLISDKLISFCLLQQPEVSDSVSFPYSSSSEKSIFIYLLLA